jgi:hypothetical protein
LTPDAPAEEQEENPVTPDPTTPIEDPSPGDREADGVVVLARADLARRLGVAEEEIVLESVEAVQWPDASLGCPQPGMMYAQVITPGFQVVLGAAGTTYHYHANQGKTVILCETLPSPKTPSKGMDTTVDDGWPSQPLGNDVVIEPPAERKP